MPLSESKRQSLQTVLQRENSKQGTIAGRPPAVFRETWGDTHKTAPAEYFGPPIIDGVVRTATIPSMGRRSQSAKRATPPTFQQTLLSQPVEFRSVFQPTPEQEHVCTMARERRQRLQNSEWALLDTLETAMYMDERDHRKRVERELAAQQRRALDGQVAVKETLRHQELRDLAREKELVAEQVAASQEEERLVGQVAQLKALKLRQERETLVARNAKEKERAAMRARAEEAKILKEAERQLEGEKRKAEAKAVEARAQALQQREDNAARMAARKAEEAKIRAMDEALMKETMKTLEQRERMRGEEMKRIQEKSALRSQLAGSKAMDERREREERAERLAAKFEDQKEREWQARTAREAERRKNQKAELLAANQAAATLKAQRAAEAREGTLRERADAETRARLEREAEEAKARGMRERTRANTEFLKGQMTTKEMVGVTDDTGMSEEERRLNLRLLEQAVALVGPVPRQMAVKW